MQTPEHNFIVGMCIISRLTTLYLTTLYLITVHLKILRASHSLSLVTGLYSILRKLSPKALFSVLSNITSIRGLLEISFA